MPEHNALRLLQVETPGGASPLGALPPAHVFPTNKNAIDAMTAAQMNALSTFYNTTFDLPNAQVGVLSHGGHSAAARKEAIRQWLCN